MNSIKVYRKNKVTTVPVVMPGESRSNKPKPADGCGLHIKEEGYALLYSYEEDKGDQLFAAPKEVEWIENKDGKWVCTTTIGKAIKELKSKLESCTICKNTETLCYEEKHGTIITAGAVCKQCRRWRPLVMSNTVNAAMG